jgi:NADPH:quinone reductase-like Zn-dependent oxidoreductase
MTERTTFAFGYLIRTSEVNFGSIIARRLTLTGSTLRAREPEFKAAIATELEKQVWPFVSAGKYQAHVFKTFPFSEAAAAHRLMESSKHMGKIVMIPREFAVKMILYEVDLPNVGSGGLESHAFSEVCF